MFRYPYLTPGMVVGLQVNNPGQGGPSGNPHARDNLARTWPYFAGGYISGLHIGPNIAQARPQMPVANQWADPSTYTTIPGMMKAPSFS